MNDPVAVAAHFGTDLGAVLRRWALLHGNEVGLVVCDASGTPTFRKSVGGFAIPPFGAACPLWPLYTALTAPGLPIRAAVEQAGREPRAFLTYAVSLPDRPAGFAGPVVHEATMVILPDPPPDMRVDPVGPACRICPRPDCLARREPSILAER